MKSLLKLFRFTFTFLLSLNFFFSQAQVIQDGLVAYWPFDSSANDISGNGNHGSVNGATLTNDRFGNSNSAYFFDGTNDYIDCGNDKSILVSTNTTNFWFRYKDTTVRHHMVNNFNSFNGEWGVTYYHNATNGLTTSVTGGASNNYLACVTKKNFRYADSVWHMFTSTYQAKDNVLKLYLDGCFVTNVNLKGGTWVNGKDSLTYNTKMHLTFGASSQYLAGEGGDPGFLDGCLDDIAIYNRALAPYEIMMLFVDKPASIANQDAKNVTIYPNPTADKITILSNNNFSIIGCNANIYNTSGQIVHTVAINSDFQQISLAGNISSGMYILEVVDPLNNTATIRKKITLID